MCLDSVCLVPVSGQLNNLAHSQISKLTEHPDNNKTNNNNKIKKQKKKKREKKRERKIFSTIDIFAA